MKLSHKELMGDIEIRMDVQANTRMFGVFAWRLHLAKKFFCLGAWILGCQYKPGFEEIQ